MSATARMTKGEWIDAIASIGEMHKFMVAKTERSSIMLGIVENGLIEISFKLLDKVSIVVSNVYAFIDEVRLAFYIKSVGKIYFYISMHNHNSVACYGNNSLI